MKRIRLNFDGGASPNPGRGHCGSVCFGLEGETIFGKNLLLGDSVTNNVAEYCGLILGLSSVRAFFGESSKSVHLLVKGDSRLVVKQMQGAWDVKQDRLRALQCVAFGLAQSFGKVAYGHVMREENEIADLLSKSVHKYQSVLPFAPSKNCTLFDVCGFTRLGTFDAKNNGMMLIDSVFLLSLPNGRELLQSLSTSELNNCRNNKKLHMFVMGELKGNDLHVSFNGKQLDFERILVVDNLYVPFHCSMKKGFKPKTSLAQRLEQKLFPEPFRSHLAWKL